MQQLEKKVQELSEQLDKTIDGTLANAIAGMNGAYYVEKAVTKNAVLAETEWISLAELEYTLPKKSIVIMSVSLAASREAPLFVDNKYYVTQKEEGGSRIQAARAFIGNKNHTIKINFGGSADNPLTIYGNSDTRGCRVDYLVVPLE